MIDDFIQKIPKAELHLHIEGTLEPELMFKLAQRNKINLPYPTIQAVHEAYQFNNLQSFLDLYYAGMSVLVTEEDFYELTFSYLQKVHNQNVRHAEIFFDPQPHLNNGTEFSVVINGISKALEDAQKKLDISTGLILCFLRDLSTEDAEKVLDKALLYKNKIIGVGLDSAEQNNPPVKFKSVFGRARQNGLLTVAHAGEEGPPDYIWQALDILKVSRVDHGVRCLEDKNLVKRLVAEKIPLTVCPISNVKLKGFKTMSDHPIKKMLDENLCVTINSDDPAYFSGYINENYSEAQKAHGLNKAQIYQIAKNSFEASFIDDVTKQKYIAQLDKYYHANMG